MTQTAIIIVSWNSCEDLRLCLESLKGNIPQNCEILVVDNASTDETPQMVKRDFPWVRLLDQTENLGFAKANNLAAASTDAEYLMILNPDTRVYPEAIPSLISFLEETPRAGLAAPLLLDKGGVPIPSVFRFPSLWNYWTEHSIFLWIREKIRNKIPMSQDQGKGFSCKSKEIDWATGAAFMVRRSALGGDPLFDERFFLYSEDADLCRRLMQKGWKRYIYPRAKVIHSHRGSSRKALARTIVQLFQSMDLYFALHKGKLGRFCLRCFICLDMVIRLLLLMIIPRKQAFHTDNEERRKAYRKVIRTLHPFRLKTSR
jgi:hypothetical protein